MKTIIMAGGSGTRLWPLSRTNYPKQFLKLNGMDKSIFQLTMQRCLKMCSIEDIFIVTNAEYKFLIFGQIEEMGYNAPKENILLEPMSKNTLPAIYNGVKAVVRSSARGATQVTGTDKNVADQGAGIVVAVFASDHLISDTDKFISQIKAGIPLTDEYLLTFGVKPTTPETGYGYLKPGKKLPGGMIVDEFKEKPNGMIAEQYVKDGYYWNSGMFMFRTDIFVDEVERHCPEVAKAFESDDVNEAFERSPSISIDYGVMEKSSRVAMIPLSIDWNDLGSFATFYEQYDAQKDEKGNVIFGDDNMVMFDCENNMVYTDGEKAVAVIGVDGLVVVDQKDALLICHRDRTQAVKNVVNTLKARGDHRVDFHRTEYRPWGSFTILEEGQFYKIKRLTVLPGKILSYQMHYHRSEHWIAVSGTGVVVRDGEEIFFKSGENVFVPAGHKHRLKNPGKLLLEVIEVQSGLYLGEDDIVRYEDEYDRINE